MFVRFRQTEHRLQVCLVETRRVAGKVRHEHVASLGAIETPPTVEARLAFWRKIEDRLAKLGNRISPAEVARIRGSLYTRIPMPSVEEQRTVQLTNAQSDEELLAGLHDMHAAMVAGHQEMATTVESKIAEGRSALADAAARLRAARERVAAIERGEVVSGGLGKPMSREDMIRMLKATGWTDAEIDHMRALGEMPEPVFRAFLQRLPDLHERVDHRLARAMLRQAAADGSRTGTPDNPPTAPDGRTSA